LRGEPQLAYVRGVFRVALRIALPLVAFLASTFATGSTLDALNSIRAQGCAGKPGVTMKLARDGSLNEVAQRMSSGASLADAIAAAHFHARLSSSIAIAGAADERALARLIAERFCTEVLNGDFQRAGIWERGKDTWIVLATPFNVPLVKDATAIRRRALELVNQARARARTCGSVSFEAARPLKLDAVLDKAALIHSLDMAEHGRMTHRGSDGSSVAERTKRVGYTWRKVGENVAAGTPAVDDVVRGWLGSPTHCVNIMNPDFTQMGIAYAVNAASEDGIYWTQVFAIPR
jgi:uncharacterized protein YkwD